jgi:hypothetical protein
MHSLLPWKHLFPEVKQKTADLQMLRVEVCQNAPFSEKPKLAECIEEHLEREPDNVSPVSKPWLASLGQGLSQVLLEDAAETERIRRLAERLAATCVQFAPELETVPYLAGVPAGTPRRIDALWSGFTLYVALQSVAKAAAPVAQEIGRAFDRRDIIDACKLCYERAPEFVYDYLQANFRLEAPPIESEMEAGQKATPESGRQARPEFSSATGPETAVQILESPETTLEEPAALQEDLAGERRAAQALNGDDTETTGPLRPAKPLPPRPKPEPSLMERFAQAIGFSSDGLNRFSHPDGRSIQRVRESSFPWELYSRSGEVIRRYWTKEHCLELSPLELEAEIWALCDKQPDQHSLILTTPGGAPLEIPGAVLKEMRDIGRLTLHAATYRLVLRNEAGSDAE